VRQEFLQELRNVIEKVDVQPRHDPIFTMLDPYAIQHAVKLRSLLDENKPDIITGTAAIWKKLWRNFQPTSAVMETFVDGCKSGKEDIRHMLASKRLADTFEEGGQVDDSMYGELTR